MRKNVQIPQELFLALIRYHVFDFEEDEDQIRKGLEEKLNAMYMHELYEKSKTAPTEKEKETARKAYLDERGIPTDFRW